MTISPGLAYLVRAVDERIAQLDAGEWEALEMEPALDAAVFETEVAAVA